MSTQDHPSSSLSSTNDSLYRKALKKGYARIRVQIRSIRRTGILLYGKSSELLMGCSTFKFLVGSGRRVSACGPVTRTTKRQSFLSSLAGSSRNLIKVFVFPS